jgi:hypothetical protein
MELAERVIVNVPFSLLSVAGNGHLYIYKSPQRIYSDLRIFSRSIIQIGSACF